MWLMQMCSQPVMPWAVAYYNCQQNYPLTYIKCTPQTVMQVSSGSSQSPQELIASRRTSLKMALSKASTSDLADGAARPKAARTSKTAVRRSFIVSCRYWNRECSIVLEVQKITEEVYRCSSDLNERGALIEREVVRCCVLRSERTGGK